METSRSIYAHSSTEEESAITSSYSAYTRARTMNTDASLLRDIVRTHHVLTAVFSNQIGITEARLHMLRQFKSPERDTGEVSQAELCERLGVNPAVVTRQIKQLEEEGLVTRRSDPKDNRVTLAKLTAKGEEVLAELLRRSHEFEMSLLDGLTSDEVHAARLVLNHLRSRLDHSSRNSANSFRTVAVAANDTTFDAPVRMAVG